VTAVLDSGEQRLARLIAQGVEGLDTPALLARLIRDEFPGRIAVVSSFGAESAVLLHLVAAIAPATPVLFLDTDKLFGETLRYKDRLVARLGLTGVREIRPDPALVAARDPDGTLWARDADACCGLRKVEPLARAIAPFAASINGRKRYQGATRAAIPLLELDDGHIKINPLADWDKARIDRYFVDHDLPPHPLVEDGYRSIGCMPCSDRVADGEDDRAGRWRGLGKIECGIHRPKSVTA
jgi:phosphoadenosine phosphosulfate reductase